MVKRFTLRALVQRGVVLACVLSLLFSAALLAEPRSAEAATCRD
jgi:hypothetical protein